MPASAAAEELEERLQRLERRLEDLQGKLSRQGELIADQAATIERLRQQRSAQQATGSAPAGHPGSNGRFQDISVGGLVEVEGGYADGSDGEGRSDLVLASVELTLGAQINDWFSTQIVFLHEDEETDFGVDEGTITLANPEHTPLFVTAGRMYVPFGAFETNMVSDPLTLELGETRETALQAGFEQDRWSGSVYTFNGDTNQAGSADHVEHWGANLRFTHATQDGELSLGLGFINSLGDSDALQDALTDAAGMQDRVPGVVAHGLWRSGPWSLIGEYLTATQRFDVTDLAFAGAGAKPSAWNIEAGFGFRVAGRDTVLALGFQGTDEALALALSEERYLVTWAIDLKEHTALKIEWAHDKGYASSVGATGSTANTGTAQIAVEF